LAYAEGFSKAAKRPKAAFAAGVGNVHALAEKLKRLPRTGIRILYERDGLAIRQ
jgi:hypothetical protein